MKNIDHKPIPDYPAYYASIDGDIWSTISGKYLKPAKDKKGYLRCVLNGRTRKVHRLVLSAFDPVSDISNLNVNHINLNKADNRLSNLEWVTPRENTHHAISNGVFKLTAGWNKITLNDDIISKLGTMPDYKLAKLAGCSKPVIRQNRIDRGIPSFAAKTGNNGRFKKGDPHPRWER